MPIPTVITDLSTTASSNSPQGSETPTEGDNHIRALASIIRQEHDNFADTSNVANGDAMVGVKSVLAGSVGTTQHEVNARIVNAFDFMTAAQIADVKARAFTLDVAAAINAAITAASPNGQVLFPVGGYRVNSQLTVAANRVHLLGAGSFATEIRFFPTANGTCLKLSAGALLMSQGSVRGISFYSTDSTFTKTAIEMIDVDLYTFEDVTVGGSIAGTGGASSSFFWSGAGSIGIRTRGRDLTRLRGITVFADRALLISPNPNNQISLDHFHFTDCYFASNNNPIVEVESGSNLSQITFDGYQAWVLGTTGFKWIDTTSTVTSEGLVFCNVREEQGMDATAYFFDIQHNQALQSPVFRNCYGGISRRGARLRKCENVNFDQHLHAGATEAVNVDATVKRIKMNDCFWQAASTASMAGQRLVFGTPLNPNTAPLPGNAIYDESANAIRNAAIDMAIAQPPITVANNAATAISVNGTNMQGLLLVTDERGLAAIFLTQGNNGVSTEVSDPTGFFSPTAGNAGTINVYWSAGNTRYELENKSGGSRNLKLTLLGSYGQAF